MLKRLTKIFFYFMDKPFLFDTSPIFSILGPLRVDSQPHQIVMDVFYPSFLMPSYRLRSSNDFLGTLSSRLTRCNKRILPAYIELQMSDCPHMSLSCQFILIIRFISSKTSSGSTIRKLNTYLSSYYIFFIVICSNQTKETLEILNVK